MNLLDRKNWNPDEAAYVSRLGPSRRVFAWWMREQGGSWVVQVVDNHGNQLGEANYYANRKALKQWSIEWTK